MSPGTVTPKNFSTVGAMSMIRGEAAPTGRFDTSTPAVIA